MKVRAHFSSTNNNNKAAKFSVAHFETKGDFEKDFCKSFSIFYMFNTINECIHNGIDSVKLIVKIQQPITPNLVATKIVKYCTN